MKSFAMLALFGAVNANRVHDFMAESNFICSTCETVIESANAGDDYQIEKLYKIFPKLQEKINKFSSNKEIVDLNDPRGTCVRMGMCAAEYETAFEEEVAFNHEVIVNAVNSNPKSTWKAGVNEKFDGASIKQIKQHLGTVVDSDWAISLHKKQATLTNEDLPVNFDSRTNWPECEGVINHIRDQSNCGSCWAHGTTEALNDRICIASNGQRTDLLSVSDTTACCNGMKCFSFGCNGGQVGTPWAWFVSSGVVTGGDFGDDKLCYDYTMPQCAHHVTGTGLPSCDDVKQVQPTCKNSCQKSDIDYSSDKNHASSSYGFRDVNAAKQDIMQYGSVTGAFTVYEDFPTYKSGVYRHQSGKALGGHAIKVIGWGTENGEDYWLCINSWNNTWGDKGTFKIAVGECGIDNQMHAGQV